MEILKGDALKMLIMTEDKHIKEYSRIVKYHKELAGFDFRGTRKIKALLYRRYTYVSESSHFYTKLDNIYHNNIGYTMDEILKYGHIFEYKLLDNKYLYRIAIRMYGIRFDTIYIIQPIYYSEGIFLKLITCYTNNKNDKHFTLNKKRYA